MQVAPRPLPNCAGFIQEELAVDDRSTVFVVFRLGRFPGQALGLQSFVIFPESLLRFFVVGRWLAFGLKSLSRRSLRGVLACSIAHRSHPFFGDPKDDDRSGGMCRKETR